MGYGLDDDIPDFTERIDMGEEEEAAPSGLPLTEQPRSNGGIIGARSRLSLAYADLTRTAEKRFHLRSSLIRPTPLSTGSLVVDYIMSGGLYTGMSTFSGPEASGKTTLMWSSVKSAIAEGTPMITTFDVENSVDPVYTSGILGQAIEELFGGDNPLVRYYPEAGLETFYGYVHSIMNNMPIKTFDAERETWAYFFPKNNEKAKKLMAVAGFRANRDFTDDRYYGVPTDYAGPEAFFSVDSYAALLPDIYDDDEKDVKTMAVVARAFSEGIRTIAGKFRNRAVVIAGTNQIREKPGVVFGDPRYEVGGSALKFYSNFRAWISPVSIPPGEGLKTDETKKMSYEQSVFNPDRFDRYQYKQVKCIKNKNGVPFRQCVLRTWNCDHEDRGRGLDPVYDTFKYLMITGQLRVEGEGEKRQLFVNIEPFTSIPLPWYVFKMLVLADEYELPDLARQAIDFLRRNKITVDSVPRIRQHCRLHLKAQFA